MTRRADMVMSETIANRTSIDQELKQGLNLWVDVSGERYETDSLDNNGSIKADMGDAAFGADIAVTDSFTTGAAIQYGNGSLRRSSAPPSWLVNFRTCSRVTRSRPLRLRSTRTSTPRSTPQASAVSISSRPATSSSSRASACACPVLKRTP